MIDLLPSDEQEELVSWASGVLDKELDPGELLKHDRESFPVGALVTRLGALGFLALTESEAAGGGGRSHADESLVFRELGRRIAPGPFVATLLAARVARQCGDDAAADALLAGERMAVLAERRHAGRAVVWDGGDAAEILLVDDAAATVERFPADALVGSTSVASIDPYHRVAMFEGATPDSVLGSVTGARARRLIAHGRLLTAAFLAGLAEGARDHSAAYAKERVQFGRPIGTFQAVKHRCADTAVRAESAWAQTAVASLRLDAVGADTATLDIAVAKIVAGEAAVRNARDDIQNHGGIGYTFESSAHLFLKRAHIYCRTFGEARELRTLVLEGAESW